MSFLKRLFGGSEAPKGEAAVAGEAEHNGFMIRATPFKEGGQFQTCGVVVKEVPDHARRQGEEHHRRRAEFWPPSGGQVAERPVSRDSVVGGGHATDPRVRGAVDSACCPAAGAAQNPAPAGQPAGDPLRSRPRSRPWSARSTRSRSCSRSRGVRLEQLRREIAEIRALTAGSDPPRHTSRRQLPHHSRRRPTADDERLTSAR